MAKVITVANSKGGVGKTTLCLYLYRYLVDQGANVAICDLDYQASITRLDTGAHLVEVDQVEAFNGFVLVDTPPYRSAELPGLLRKTDFLLIPCKPSVMDLQAAAYVIAEAKEAKVNHAICLNMVKPGTSFLGDIRGQVEAQGWPLMRTEIRDRVTYARALLYQDGLQAENNRAALDEIADLTNEILIRITDG